MSFVREVTIAGGTESSDSSKATELLDRKAGLGLLTIEKEDETEKIAANGRERILLTSRPALGGKGPTLHLYMRQVLLETPSRCRYLCGMGSSPPPC